MTGPPIVFSFDFISPYAYLAWTQIHALAARHGRAVTPRPILFAALLNAHGTKGPAEIAPKRVYVFKDALRRAARYGVPFAPPPSHPFNPLLALRAVHASGMHRGLIDALFAATWGEAEHRGVEHPDVVAACADAVGLDGVALVERAGAADVKDAVRAATDAALAEGVFGVPTMTVGDEPFWGTDSLPLLEQHLRGEDPVTPALLERVRAIRASASRR
ncbi:MAG: 2-hydroxychromene-2-carboxylate isomerase [Sandaracinaceae bacterium]|nr:2-hydroxychromene-2-carboxylate isomerase [Sandaracinaceae bacterium]